jgi:ABC-type dipeptide/oligopeptide/nickel transport system ATPase component
MTSLNPYLTIELQLVQVVRAHERVSAKAARARCIEMLDAVAIPEAAARFKRYPHELSGGMRQRVMIAASLLLGPQILIADEPTTALDVTVQAQILELMKEIKRRSGTAIILITHTRRDRRLADRVVMHGGESRSRARSRTSSRHEYTCALLRGAAARRRVPRTPRRRRRAGAAAARSSRSATRRAPCGAAASGWGTRTSRPWTAGSDARARRDARRRRGVGSGKSTLARAVLSSCR